MIILLFDCLSLSPSTPPPPHPPFRPYTAKLSVHSTARIITTIVSLALSLTHTHSHAKCATCLPATPSVLYSLPLFFFLLPPSLFICLCFCTLRHLLFGRKGEIHYWKGGVGIKTCNFYYLHFSQHYTVDSRFFSSG